MTRDYLACIWARVAGLATDSLVDIYAARDMATLTRMVQQRGLATNERVVYHRQ
jgi:hypothetical protein